VANVQLEPDAGRIEIGGLRLGLLADLGALGADQDVLEERPDDRGVVGIGDAGIGGQVGLLLDEVCAALVLPELDESRQTDRAVSWFARLSSIVRFSAW
jgi:hypothetical protein